MRNYFVYDGTDSRSFGVYLNGRGTFDSPSRAAEFIVVPGRNGDLIGRETRINNLEYRYPEAFIYSNFAENMEKLRSFLLSKNGYRRLTDSYHPGEFLMAAFVSEITATVQNTNDAGKFDLIFRTKPQRYLVSGESVTTLNSSGSITNPTPFNAAPLLRVYGNGTLGINSDSITISAYDVYTDIDCENMIAYKGTASKNSYVSVSGTDFPTLKPGANSITLGTGITSIQITPRWFML